MFGEIAPRRDVCPSTFNAVVSEFPHSGGSFAVAGVTHIAYCSMCSFASWITRRDSSSTGCHSGQAAQRSAMAESSCVMDEQGDDWRLTTDMTRLDKARRTRALLPTARPRFSFLVLVFIKSVAPIMARVGGLRQSLVVRQLTRYELRSLHTQALD